MTLLFEITAVSRYLEHLSRCTILDTCLLPSLIKKKFKPEYMITQLKTVGDKASLVYTLEVII